MTNKRVIFQRDAMDCGVAAFAMIAAHYGRNLDLEDIRDSCSLNKEGVSLLSISKTAEKFGSKTVPFALATYWCYPIS